MDQRNQPGTGRDVRCVRSKRSVGTYPAERLLLSPSDLPERQPVVLCSSQRDQRGWWQRVPILWERKGEIAAKSCSYADVGNGDVMSWRHRGFTPMCHGPAGVPGLATRCLCVLSTWLVVCCWCHVLPCLLPPSHLVNNHCFSGSTCVSLVTLVCPPI